MNIALIGLDTSHVKVFSRILNDPSFEHFMPGMGRVTAGYPGGSPDFPASISRVDGYVQELGGQYGVEIADSPEQAAEKADMVFITAVDGRIHPDLFSRVAPLGKPVFIDKPFAVDSQGAMYMAELAAKHNIPYMSSSVRRYSPNLTAALASSDKGAIQGAECYGPIEFIPSQPGWYWYGIHTVEVLYAVMGKGCESVSAISKGTHEVIIGHWRDGRIGIARGNRQPNNGHGAIIHREKCTEHVDTGSDGLKKYACLLSSVLEMGATGRPTLEDRKTLEIIRFIEAANESRVTGQIVSL